MIQRHNVCFVFLETMSAAASSGSVRNKIALITGITGQDGSYLAEFLLQKVSFYCRFALIPT
jgi:hypothetical protein